MRALMLIVLLAACAKDPAATTNAAASTAAGTTQTAEQRSGPRVILPDGFVVHVEIAANDELRAQGLMYRDRLRDGTGMLFMFAQDGDYPFWMKNTRIPLDMIWIDANGRIAAMHENAQPCQTEECPNYPPNAIARYVLELNGGTAKEHGLKVGDLLQIEGTGSVIVR